MSDLTSPDQGTSGPDGAGVQSTDQGAASVTGQPGTSTVGEEFEIGGEKFNVDRLKTSYAELRKKFTQDSQSIAAERKANEWLTTRLRELHASSPEDWSKLKAILNGQRLPTQAPAAQGQAQADPRIEEMDKARRLTDARLEIFEFQRKHPDVSEDQVRDLVKGVVEADMEGKNYSLEDFHILKNHKSELAKAAEAAQRKTEESVQKGRNATALGTGATTAQVPAKTKNFFKIKDENEANAYILDKLKKAGAKFDD